MSLRREPILCQKKGIYLITVIYLGAKVMAEQVDNIICTINSYWSRYGNLLYQTAFQDAISLLAGN